MLGISIQALEDDDVEACLAASPEALEDDGAEVGWVASLKALKVKDDGTDARSTVSLASSTLFLCRASIASPSIPVTFPPDNGSSCSASGTIFALNLQRKQNIEPN